MGSTGLLDIGNLIRKEITGDCNTCPFWKSMGNKYPGRKIPGGYGKCTLRVEDRDKCVSPKVRTKKTFEDISLRPGVVQCSRCGSDLDEGTDTCVCGAINKEKASPPDPDQYAGHKSENRIWEIPLEQIRPAPWNPPARMDPKLVEELADSMALHGQQIPGLIRPIDSGSPAIKYELVFGHRRYAGLQLKNGCTVPFKAFIRMLSEEEAMILSGIENLQRQGFTDIEEAQFFKTAGERYGESAVKILSEKLSVSERYIRKRVEILKLPEKALKLWREGTWHVGHMEQLLRLGGNDKVETFLTDLKRDQWTWARAKDWPVYQLKEQIDRQAITLSHGRFDKSDCKICRKNTDVQLTLFGGEKDKSKCLDPKCFEEKQKAWFAVNWPTCRANKFGTQTALIGDYNTQITGRFDGTTEFGHGKHSSQCDSCPNFATLLDIKGEERYGQRVCTGDSKCYNGVKAQVPETNKNASGENGGQADPDAPRVAWHGEYYRQEFYRLEIPRLLEGLLTEDPRRIQFALATIIKSRSGIHEWFCSKLDVAPPKKESWQSTVYLPFHLILKHTRSLNALQAEYLMAEALAKLSIDTGRGYEVTFTDQDRQAIALFLDIDFSRFRISEDWLSKKTKGELIKFIAHESGLAKEARFQDAMEARGIPTLEKLAAQKKPLLIDLIQNCGVDLHGRLPREIADIPRLDADRPVEQSECSAILEPPHCYVCGCSKDEPCEGGCTLTVAHGIGDEDLEGEYVCSQCVETIQREQEEEVQ